MRFFDHEGRLNRTAFTGRGFQTASIKNNWKKLLLPLILNKIQQQKQKLVSSAYGIVDVPLFFN